MGMTGEFNGGEAYIAAIQYMRASSKCLSLDSPQRPVIVRLHAYYIRIAPENPVPWTGMKVVATRN
jgi:hypothetical protein